MKITRSLRTFLFLSPLVAVLAGGVTFYFVGWQQQQLTETVETKLQPTQVWLAEGSDVVNRFAAQVQHTLTGQMKQLAGIEDNIPVPVQPVKPLNWLTAAEDRYERGLGYALDEGAFKKVADNFRAYVAEANALESALQYADGNDDELRETLIDGIANFSLRLAAQRDDLLALFADAQRQVGKQLEANAAEREQLGLLGLIGLGGGILLAFLLYILQLGRLGAGVHTPLRHLLESLTRRSKLQVADTEFGHVASHLNHVHDELRCTQQVLIQFAEGAYLDPYPAEKLSEPMGVGFEQLRDQFKRLDGVLKQKETDLENCVLRSKELDNKLKETQQRLQAEIDAQKENLVYAEVDSEGKFIFANNHFLRLGGHAWTELQDKPLSSWVADARSASEVQNGVQAAFKGNGWSGIVKSQAKDGAPLYLATSVHATTNGNGHPKRAFLVAFDITEEQRQKESATRELEAQRSAMAEAQHKLEATLSELADLRGNIAKQHALELRLTQQQAALQELTRSTPIKAGDVRQALRAITETVTYSLDVSRVGLWLFTVNGERIRCIDIYERDTMKHEDGYEVKAEDAPAFAKAMRERRVHLADDTAAVEWTQAMQELYFETYNVQAVASAPIQLGGSMVGFVLAEHTGETRAWLPDEENFLHAVGDVVSLALEQGNRKAMEEELRMTLEESQALEEELRQNAEEIEATNEEMRRTQVELRGQINALDNAAIVSETNPQGIITYANEAFLKAYNYTSKRLLGQNHRILKSNYHDSGFFHDMWATLTAGNVWLGEVMNQTSEGAPFWVKLTITPVLGLDGKPYKFISVGFDISQQKSQEQQVKSALDVALQQEEQLRTNSQELVRANEEMKRAQLELVGQIGALNSSALVYETDMEGNIIAVNDELLKLSGYTKEELVGEHFAIFRSETHDVRVYDKQWNAMQAGKRWRGELEHRTKSGGTFWAVVVNNPVLDESGQPLKSINVLVDISEQKGQEFRLKRQQQAMIELTQHPAIKDGKPDEAYPLIARIGRETLNVSRVAVWMNIEEDSKVKCVAVEQNTPHPHSLNTEIERSMYPAYFRTLDRERIVASNNPLEDERTSELGFNLLKPEGITGVMDVAIRYGAKTVGILSIETRSDHDEWTVDQISFATSLADSVGLVIEQKAKQQTDKLRLAYQQLEEANAEVLRQKSEMEEQATFLTESIRYAKRIQNNILPDKILLKQGLGNYFIVFRPRDIVGGDFYWFSNINERQRVIIIADGTGHGVPGAFLTLIGYLLLNQIVNEKGYIHPDEILYHLHIGVRVALKQDEEESTSRDGMDVAVAMVDIESLDIEYAGANLPFYYYQDWEVHEVKPTKKSIGGEQLEEERTFDLNKITLKPGDAMYMYTDGFVDQLGGPDEKRFSKKRFRDLILRTQHESMKTQRALLNLEWKDWKDDREQLDDVTVFGMKF